ncbi:MAG: sugar phosphate nucleotidyltransferase [Acidobacteriota bacterium]|nr:sugar phosphate nucleotidyltransferase [Acidobacteriota bacterium]MDH3784125.1 sugar phosphate nucleotidyltransferase [Acidobacteriota bacterium]
MERVGQRPEDVIVVILGGGRGTRLEPLTWRRSKPAVPIAGKYRLIDIPISNAIHSHMERMLVLTQYNSVSLHRHIAQTYRFDIFSKGFVQILAAQQTPADAEGWFQGTADAVRRNLWQIRESPGDLVLILSGDHIYRMDYRQMLRDHVEANADLTIAALPCSEDEISSFGAMRVDESGCIREFREKPKTAADRAGLATSPELLAERGIEGDRPYLASMGIYLFRKQALVDCLDNDLVDFGNNVIPAALQRFKLQSHFFSGYWRDIGTIRTFYDAHMDLVRADPPFDFNDESWSFYTHPRYLPGSRLRGCTFTEALLAGGASMEDSVIERSVIGIRSRLSKATVKNSLIMGVEEGPPSRGSDFPPIGIGEGSLVDGAIVDLNARIGRNVEITNREGVDNADGDGWVIRDGIVVVAKNTVIPDNTKI